eukprot:gnl/MRDRNA2_/MRDRNA2_107643_c0_seq1.p1 gnl/MRDRNA2_/MRDRNA2_107643_c0~~gnl/MRDRNA2_/MRDRNA2_107643_c0_seq1.p1  ORF type:complete len:212 (+),score=49.04 gnl/MRDRNA2_/MRDRNA2_107643_c0_seq1:82-636(+)
MSGIQQKEERTQLQSANGKLKAIFHAADANEDGKISMQELMRVLTEIGERWTEEEFDKLFKEADVNKNGYLEIDEFINWLVPQSMTVRTSLMEYVEDIKSIFDQFDTDESGTISLQELEEGLEQRLIHGLPSSRALVEFIKADTNRNDRISLGEFIVWAKEHIPKDEWMDSDLDRWAASRFAAA